jgi:lipid A ethanolaminephosphotransferase
LNAGQPGFSPRDTTPRLARLAAEGTLINVPDVHACGTNTETSLPCMFAPVGRRDYDEARIRGQQSLLHVAARAGVQVLWRDNQSGCKGVCDGLPSETVDATAAPGLCPEGRCFDEALLHDLDQRLARAQGTQLLVLHTIGSHGPAYFRRYPRAFAHFQPECQVDDLRHCSAEQIRNAFDNTLRYTDHVLASAINTLRAHADRVDSALVYVSDHGESLGEYGLFLHGVPYAMAPEVQTRVPMVAWASPGLERAAGMATGCLRKALTTTAQPVAHDHLFPVLLGLLDVRTALREPALDLLAPCRADPAPQ